MRSEFEDYSVSKHNRRSGQEPNVHEVRYHPFKRKLHEPDPNSLQRRAHLRERKAIKKGR